MWNNLATIIAMKRNLVGAVVYGAITEVNAIRAKGFPCYTTALTTVSGKDVATALKNIPVQIGGVWIHPGDWLIGDDSGIICIPATRIFEMTERSLQVAQYKEQVYHEIEEVAQSDKLKALVQAYENGAARRTVAVIRMKNLK